MMNILSHGLDFFFAFFCMAVGFYPHYFLKEPQTIKNVRIAKGMRWIGPFLLIIALIKLMR